MPGFDPFLEESITEGPSLRDAGRSQAACVECGKRSCICEEEREELAGLEPDEELDFSHGN